MTRVHITIPKDERKLFDEYAHSYQLSLSSFFTKSALEKIRKHKGYWRSRVNQIERPGELSKEEFMSMAHDELWRLYG